MSTDQPKQNTDNLTEEEKSAEDQASHAAGSGHAGERGNEKFIVYNPAQREKIIKNDDSYIVLGGDRICTPASGKAGEGFSGAHMIDLVVGRDPDLSGHPSFKNDAARIYISQKSDLDHALGLARGNVGNIKNHSAIGIKADGIRIVAREGIKIVTMEKGTQLSGPNKNKTKTYHGIDLIANNNEEDLEPIAKTEKLVDAFEMVIDAMNELARFTENFMNLQMQFNSSVSMHTHGITYTGITKPVWLIKPPGRMRFMSTAEIPLKSYRPKINALKKNHLTPLFDGYIGSRYNFTN